MSRLLCTLTLVACLSSAPLPAQAEEAQACHCLRLEAPPGKFPTTTGDAKVDGYVGGAEKQLGALFEVRPHVLFLDDADEPAAYAAARTSEPERTGTLLLGVRLLREEAKYSGAPEAAVFGIVAHEFAHVVQWQRRCELRGQSRELHADYLAGWALGRRDFEKLRGRGVMRRAFADVLFRRGDNAFRHADHHGTPRQRVGAMLAGYAAARKPLAEAYAAAVATLTGKKAAPPPAPPKPPPAPAPAPAPAPSPLWRNVKVPCTHKVACTHRVRCRHKVRCRHEVPCRHKIPCVHRGPCRHKVRCKHTVQCVHEIPCTHRRHQYDLLHQYDLDAHGRRVPCTHRTACCHPQHRFDLAHPWDYAHRFDLAHEFDPLHPHDLAHPCDLAHNFDYAHAFDPEHAFDLAHKYDLRKVAR